MPASSASRRSVSSPHWPRTSGRRNALTSERVSFCSACCPTATDSIELLQAAERFGALLLDALDLLLGLAQRVANRRDQRLDGLLTLHQRGGGVLVVLAEVLARQLQEHFVVRAQRRTGHAVEARAQPLDGLVERRLPLAVDLFVGLDLRVARTASSRCSDSRLRRPRHVAASTPTSTPMTQADERRDDDSRAHSRASAPIGRTPQMHHVIHVHVAGLARHVLERVVGEPGDVLDRQLRGARPAGQLRRLDETLVACACRAGADS